MKVLHISSGNLYGGIESMLVTMARHRDECEGLEQEFGLCFEGRVAKELRSTGVRMHVFGDVRLSRPFSVRRARRRLDEVLRNSSFDAVVCHGPWSLAVYGATIRATGVPVVFWAHDAHSGRHWIERLAAFKSPALVIANSAFSARAAAVWLPTVPRRVIHCPVANTDASIAKRSRADVRAELDTPLDSTVVMLAGRMEAWKGHSDLLGALATTADNARWFCWIAGGPQRVSEFEYAESLVRLASELGISQRVRFCGQRQDVPSLLAAADVYCQQNARPEPFGISFVEAMSSGLPVVSTAIGGALEIVDESCGFLVRPGDRQALAQVLRQLIDDPALRSRLGRSGQSRAIALCSPRGRLADFAMALVHVASCARGSVGAEPAGIANAATETAR